VGGNIVMYTKYKNFIDKYIDISLQDWEIYKSKIKIEYYKKGQIIHHAGEICNKIGFINSGLARVFVLNNDGKEYTWNILFHDEYSKTNNLIVVDYYSFLSRKESIMSIEILEDSEMLMLNYEDMQFLHKHVKSEAKMSRIMTEIAYITLYKKLMDRQLKTSEDRFIEFMQTTPYLLDKVPQYHIATYLGMTPQYLSQLKKEYQY